MVKIITEPTDKEIDENVDNSDLIVIINYKNPEVINDFIESSKRDGVDIVYIHHYPKVNKYTIGIKNLCIKCGKVLGIEYWKVFNHEKEKYENFCLKCVDKASKKLKIKKTKWKK